MAPRGAAPTGRCRGEGLQSLLSQTHCPHVTEVLVPYSLWKSSLTPELRHSERCARVTPWTAPEPSCSPTRQGLPATRRSPCRRRQRRCPGHREGDRQGKFGGLGQGPSCPSCGDSKPTPEPRAQVLLQKAAVIGAPQTGCMQHQVSPESLLSPALGKGRAWRGVRPGATSGGPSYQALSWVF